MEKIWGPVNGFYVAAYAAPCAAGRYSSYAKVCWSRPGSYWEADCALKMFGGEQHRSAEGALRAVALAACNEASCLPRRARARTRQRQPAGTFMARLLATAFPRPRMA